MKIKEVDLRVLRITSYSTFDLKVKSNESINERLKPFHAYNARILQIVSNLAHIMGDEAFQIGVEVINKAIVDGKLEEDAGNTVIELYNELYDNDVDIMEFLLMNYSIFVELKGYEKEYKKEFKKLMPKAEEEDVEEVIDRYNRVIEKYLKSVNQIYDDYSGETTDTFSELCTSMAFNDNKGVTLFSKILFIVELLNNSKYLCDVMNLCGTINELFNCYDEDSLTYGLWELEDSPYELEFNPKPLIIN